MSGIVRGHRQGTLTKGGLWRTVRSVGGQRRAFVQRKGESKKALFERADRWAYENRESPNKHDVKLSRAIDLYLEFRKGADIEATTLKDDVYVGGLLKEEFGAVRIGSLDAIGVDIVLQKWARKKGKKRTAKKIRDHGRKLYNWLMAREWVAKNPFEKSTPVKYEPDQWQEPMPVEDFERALACVEVESIKAMLAVMRWTGLRPTAVRTLTWFEVTDDGEMMLVQKSSGNKNASGRLPVLVVEPAASMVRSLPRTSEYVFPSTSARSKGPWSDRWIIDVWDAAQAKAGIERRRRYELKHLRATEVTAILQRHLAAAAIGIKNPEVLEKYYVQIERKKLYQQVASIKRV